MFERLRQLFTKKKKKDSPCRHKWVACHDPYKPELGIHYQCSKCGERQESMFEGQENGNFYPLDNFMIYGRKEL